LYASKNILDDADGISDQTHGTGLRGGDILRNSGGNCDSVLDVLFLTETEVVLGKLGSRARIGGRFVEACDGHDIRITAVLVPMFGDVDTFCCADDCENSDDHDDGQRDDRR
jgi:hypothetical protein